MLRSLGRTRSLGRCGHWDAAATGTLRPLGRRCRRAGASRSEVTRRVGPRAPPAARCRFRFPFRFQPAEPGSARRPVTSEAAGAAIGGRAAAAPMAGGRGGAGLRGSGRARRRSGAERSGTMGPGPGPGLGLLLLLVLRVLGGAADGPHSLRYFTVAVSEPSPGLPKYVVVGYVDDIPFVRYDGETRKMEPAVGWMREAVDAQYWEGQTEIIQRDQHVLDMNLETLRHRYNKSVGGHMLQIMSGCDLLEDGRVRGYYQHGYDGKDFLTFDMSTMTFTALDAASQITKRKWEQDGSAADDWKYYMKNTCPEWLRKYVSYGRAALARKEPPTVRVSRMAAPGMLTLYCRAYGFYPRLITVSWVKDGETMDQETEWGSIAPNSDGTYYTSASINILPGEEHKYQCHVDHASLTKTKIYVWEPESKTFTTMVAVAVAILGVLTIAAIAAFTFWKLRRVTKGYNTRVPAEDRSQNGLATAIKP